jgi:cyclophilin family peptidyl-prolyl cis-trans isomerase
LEQVPDYRRKWARELDFRKAEAKADNLPRVKLTIADHAGHVKGEIVAELFEDEAPNTVANFISLVDKQFYDGKVFHRVLPGFMAQGGDPKGDGSGGPGYHIPEEFSLPDHHDHFRGTLSMARSESKDSAGSQFFICFAPARQLDGNYTAFGRVIEGMDVLAKIQRIDPEHPHPVQPDQILKAEVVRKRNHVYSPKTLE